MENREEYIKLLEERDNYIKEIKKLEQLPDVIKYKELIKFKDLIDEQIIINLTKYKEKEYNACNHICVNVKHIDNHVYKGCIKCGLNEYILIALDNFKNIKLSELPIQYRVMYNYLYNNPYTLHNNTYDLNIDYDLEKAHLIYEHIIETYGNLSGKDIMKEFLNTITSKEDTHNNVIKLKINK